MYIYFKGEPCPELCRICDKENETFSIFFGSEDELDAKFVLLEDCGHTFESSGMDDWMKSQSTDSTSNAIKLPECPRCRTPIRFTLRYLNYVKTQLSSIEEIKRKQYGDLKQNEKDRENLSNEMSRHEKKLKLSPQYRAYKPTIFRFDEQLLGIENY